MRSPAARRASRPLSRLKPELRNALLQRERVSQPFAQGHAQRTSPAHAETPDILPGRRIHSGWDTPPARPAGRDSRAVKGAARPTRLPALNPRRIRRPRCSALRTTIRPPITAPVRRLGTCPRVDLLQGRRVGTAMVLEQVTRGAESTETTERISWEPLADGSVRQQWQRRTGSRPWATVFDGRYSRTQRQ